MAGEGGAQGRRAAAAGGVPRPEGAGEARAGWREPAQGGHQQGGALQAERGGGLAQSDNEYKRASGGAQGQEGDEPYARGHPAPALGRQALILIYS